MKLWSGECNAAASTNSPDNETDESSPRPPNKRQKFGHELAGKRQSVAHTLCIARRRGPSRDRLEAGRRPSYLADLPLTPLEADTTGSGILESDFGCSGDLEIGKAARAL